MADPFPSTSTNLRLLQSEADDPVAVSDERLAAELLAGDACALERLIGRYGLRVRAYVGRLVQDPGWADDITQEVFVRVFERIHQFGDGFRFSVWLFRIARNLALDLVRREQLRQGSCALDLSALPATAAGSPAAIAVGREFAMAFDRALARLSEPFRSVFLLREREQMTYEEIADIVGTSAKTVSSRLHRARQHLQEALARHLEP